MAQERKRLYFEVVDIYISAFVGAGKHTQCKSPHNLIFIHNSNISWQTLNQYPTNIEFTEYVTAILLLVLQNSYCY